MCYHFSVCKDLCWEGETCQSKIHFQNCWVPKTRIKGIDQWKIFFKVRYISSYILPNKSFKLIIKASLIFSRGFFNWTWTYRADSEITDSYGYLVKHEGESHPIDATRVGHYKSIELNMEKKNKLAFWVALWNC